MTYITMANPGRRTVMEMLRAEIEKLEKERAIARRAKCTTPKPGKLFVTPEIGDRFCVCRGDCIGSVK